MARRWRGTLIVEGIETGDGRFISPNALKWEGLPLPLLWQEATSIGGHDGSVVVGTIDKITRDGAKIRGEGVFLDTAAATAAQMLVESKAACGVSADLDDVVADVEVETDDEGDLLSEPLLKVMEGRLRAATLVAIPAFIEATIELVGEDVSAPDEADVPAAPPPTHASQVIRFVAVPVHHTDISEGEWTAADHVGRLPDPLTLAVAQAMYAWVDDAADPVTGVLPHHEVADDGTPGAANHKALDAAMKAIKTTSAIPEADQQAVYDHLAAHYTDAELEPPAFSGSYDAWARVASAAPTRMRPIPLHPPERWFEPPQWTGVQPLTVTDEGRIYGHLAPWGVCHIGVQGECVVAPHSATNYGYFATGTLRTAEGTDVAVGPITMATGHAMMSANARQARDHYDHTGSVVADVAAGEDQWGAWIAGALRPDITPLQVRALRAAGLSGDWRVVAAGLELVAALAVNVEGFPKVRARVASGVATSLVASAAGMTAAMRTYRPARHVPTPAEDAMLEALASTIGRDREGRLAEMTREVHA